MHLFVVTGDTTHSPGGSNEPLDLKKKKKKKTFL